MPDATDGFFFRCNPTHILERVAAGMLTRGRPGWFCTWSMCLVVYMSLKYRELLLSFENELLFFRQKYFGKPQKFSYCFEPVELV